MLKQSHENSSMNRVWGHQKVWLIDFRLVICFFSVGVKTLVTVRGPGFRWIILGYSLYVAPVRRAGSQGFCSGILVSLPSIIPFPQIVQLFQGGSTHIIIIINQPFAFFFLSSFFFFLCLTFPFFLSLLLWTCMSTHPHPHFIVTQMRIFHTLSFCFLFSLWFF